MNVHQFVGLDLQLPGQSHGHLGDALGVAFELMLPQVEGSNPPFQRRFVCILQQAQRLLKLAKAVQANDGANPGA